MFVFWNKAIVGRCGKHEKITKVGCERTKDLLEAA